MKKIYFILVCLALSTVVFAQNERKFVRSGNKLFKEAIADSTKLDTAKFSNAETQYRKALEKRPEDQKWNFNLADAMYKQNKLEDAASQFETLGEKMKEPEDKAKAFHNLGNSLLMQKKLDESIEAYKKALRENPNDIETKYNLAYAQMLKKQQQQQNQNNQDQNKDNQDQNKDQNKDNQDQNKDQQNKDQNKDNQDQNKDQQNQNQDQNKDKKDQDKDQQDQNKDQDKDKQDQQKQQQQQYKISKQDAEQLLKALENDEKGVQEKVKKAKAAKAKQSKTDKEW